MKKLLHNKILEMLIWFYALYFFGVFLFKFKRKDKKE
jgi:hypothetical protein|tara:strand:- start:2159 stop:2269 length:111 start_codon:yes stop_codon:yes gene_type:complete